MADTLKQYAELRAALAAEKIQLEQRLSAIDEALGGGGAAVGAPSVSLPAKKRGRKPGPKPAPKVETAAKRGPQVGRGRGGNPMSLKAAIVQVTRSKALSKKEIVAAIDQLGYKFTTKNPMASLNNALYTKGLFKKAGGKFRAA